MRVALCQLDIVWEDRSANYAQIEQMAKSAAAGQCQLLILPEMFATGFSFASQKVWEEEPYASGQFMARLAQKYQLAVMGSYSRLAAPGKAFNMLELYGPSGRLLGQYAKCHLFNHTGENRLHQPGEGPKVFELDGCRVGAFICFDLRFPEQFRLVAQDMEMAVVVASWPASRAEQWDILLRARAIENQCYVIGVNRCGNDGYGIPYNGGSAIYGPNGQVVIAPQCTAGLFIGEIDLDFVRQYRDHYQFLKEKRFIG